jgi:hypothetical protein
MYTHVVIPALIIVAILIVIAVALIARRRRSDQLKRHFGPEYDRTVAEQGDTHRAEATLLEREKRLEAFPLHELTPVDREAYAMEWAAVQRRFVDDPAAAVGSADRLISRAMTDRGYPMARFEQRAEDISVSYPAVVENYRAAHDIALRHVDGRATTEELRQAMVHYRSLFEELVAPAEPSAEPSKVEPIDRRRGVARERAS